MLETYQANLLNGKIEWIDEPPKTSKPMQIAITLLPENNQRVSLTKEKRRRAPAELKGLMTFRGDIIDVPEMSAEWGVE